MEQKTKKIFLVNFLFFLTVSISIYVICRFLLQYLLPFVIAAIIAWLVQRPSRYISKKTGIRRQICAPVLALAIYLVTLIIVGLSVFRLIMTTGGLFENISGYLNELSDFFDNFQNLFTDSLKNMPEKFVKSLNTMYSNSVDSLFSSIGKILSQTATDFARKIPSLLVGIVISVVAACYIAKDYLSLARFFQGICGKKIYKNVLKVKIIFVESVLRFVKGYAVLMIITFIELCIGLMILRVKYAPLIAFVISFIDILPVLGTGTVLIPWAIIEFILYDRELGLSILTVYAVITLLRNFLEPKIIGKQLGINPLFTLLTMFIGIKLFGIIGMVILPIAFIVTVKYYKNEMEQENYSDI